MVDRIVGNRLLSANIREDIIERSDGIPLFVEEMTKAVLEAGGETAAERAIAAVPSPALAVPASLYASLMARLDRLGGLPKEVAQVAAAIGREFSHALLKAVMRKRDVELESALDRLIAAGLLFRQGLPPYATYLFKHALVRDAAYSTLLREQRRALHARIAETLEVQFADIAESRPELLARHWTEAGLIEKAASLWGKAGQRSLARSALVEAAEQLTRALDQIATLPGTLVVRREQIKLQVALVNALMHVKGYAAPELKAAVERARQFIERAEALGEPPEDPLLLFSVLYGVWAANYVAFNGDVTRDLASQFMALAEKQGQTVPLMIGHRLMGNSLTITGDISEGRAHYNQAFALYDPATHRTLATRFGQDVGVSTLVYRALAGWMLGYPEAALADADHALEDARDSGHAGTLMYAQFHTSLTNVLCAKYAAANAQSNEVVRLADEKGAALWKALGTMQNGCVLALSGKASEAIQMITSGISIAGDAADAARYALDETRSDIALQVKTGYYDAELADRSVAIMEQSVALAREHLRQVKLRFDAGRAAELDTLRAAVDLANLVPALQAARSGRDLALLNLKRLVRIPAETELRLTTELSGTASGGKPIVALALPVMAEAAPELNHRGAMQAASKAVDIRRAQVRIARAAFLPTIALSGTLNRQAFPSSMRFPKSNQWQDDWNVGFAISWPLFTGLKRTSDLDAANAGVKQAQVQLEQLRDGVHIQYQQALGDFERSKAQIDAAVRTSAQAQKVYDLTELRYAEGLATQLDVSSARLALQQARINEVQAYHDAYAALARAERTLGMDPDKTTMP